MSDYTHIIANWKMRLLPHEAAELAHQYAQLKIKNTIIVCPSFESLTLCRQEFKKSSIELGAQTCSPYSLGSYTGQVAAASLADLGCMYALVGHSECGQYGRETQQDNTRQIYQLIRHKITPIICIGEAEYQSDTSIVISLLTQQLKLLLDDISDYQEIVIAYEPQWAIGSGKMPEKKELELIFEALQNYLAENFSTLRIILLYGGSVTIESRKLFEYIPHLQGFLLGSVSLDIEKIQQILLW